MVYVVCGLVWEVLQALSLLIERERPGVLDGDSRGPLDPAPCRGQGIIRGRGLKMGKATRPSSGCGIWTSYRVQNADPYDGSRFLRGFQIIPASRTVGTDEGRELPTPTALGCVDWI